MHKRFSLSGISSRGLAALGLTLALLSLTDVARSQSTMERRERHEGGMSGVGTGVVIDSTIGIVTGIQQQGAAGARTGATTTRRIHRAARKDDKKGANAGPAAKPDDDPVTQHSGEQEKVVYAGKDADGHDKYPGIKIDVTRRQSGKTEISYHGNSGGGVLTYPLNPLGTSSTVDRGTQPKVTVTSYGHTIGTVGGEPPPSLLHQPFAGRMILFCVDGCTNVTFVQFVKQSVKYEPGELGTSDEGKWDFDTRDHKVAPYPPLASLDKKHPMQPAMYDAPGQWGPPQTDTPPKVGNTVTITNTFETFVCCDHAWIGYWTWNETLKFTWKKSEVGAGGTFGTPEVTAPDPTWHAGTDGGANTGRLGEGKKPLC
jgi:hypothetical protein